MENSAAACRCLLSKLRDFFQRPGARAAAGNFGWLAAEKAVRLVLGMVVSFWVARYLGPTQFGVLGYCMALVTLLGFLPSMGLDAVVKRELLQRPDATGELMAATVVLRVLAGAFGYAVLLLVVVVGWGVDGHEAPLLAILGLLLFQPAMWTPDLWLQAHLRAPWSVTAQLGALAVCSVTRVYLIVVGGTLSEFAMVVVLEMVLVAGGFWWAARHLGFRLALSRARRVTMKMLMSDAWPLMFASLAVVVYMKIDEVMLRQMLGSEAVGIYSAAAKLSEVWYFLPLLLASSVLPALLRARAQDPSAYRLLMQRYYDLSAGAAYMLSLPIAFAAPWLIRTAYGEAFAGAGPILAVHIWSSVFVFVGVARAHWLVNEKLQHFYMLTTFAGAVANILLNIVAIQRWGALGAAYSTVVSYAIADWLGSFFHPAVRESASMQTRALLIPFLGWRYLCRR